MVDQRSHEHSSSGPSQENIALVRISVVEEPHFENETIQELVMLIGHQYHMVCQHFR